MINKQYDLLLADDDFDDCMFFKEAVEELPFSVKLTTVNDGIELMQYLSTLKDFPDLLFLDLNMPRKGGMECLFEIKADAKLHQLQVVIFSTSLDNEVVNQLYELGANHYIRKPGEFSQLKKVIFEAIEVATQKNQEKPEKKNLLSSSTIKLNDT